jgi:glycosyltransferase involved in cell wall biosynthesis
MSSGISVVMPVHNAAATLERCLAPLVAMLARGDIEEVIVVDDCSTDRSAAIAAEIGHVRTARTNARSGPAAARNVGAALASGTHLWFVDADVVVADDAAAVLARAFARTNADAVFGCYDDAPGARNFLSQYKNLLHRYYHVRANASASTFWAGCGAVERALFLELQGFDAQRYAHPSIEDIELGYRISDTGRRIFLCAELQCKHLKEWRFAGLVRTDVTRRAIPWSLLMLERKRLTDDLNVGRNERFRALLAMGGLLALAAWAAGFAGAWLPVAAIAAATLANFELIRFFRRRRGLLFAARAFLYHQLYYLYSSAAFAYASVRHLVSQRERARAAPCAGARSRAR